jgi:tRNA dimethylallyltransferase
MPAQSPVIFIMGPTASGKTALAIELLAHFPCDIISVDSGQVYRGMDIGTAKPDAATLAQAPHRLIDIREPQQGYSAAEFRDDALREIRTITAAGRIPVLAGGTMLYFRALEHGLSPLPSADDTIRAAIEAEAREKGWEAMHRELLRIDPVAGARIHPNDPQRIERALEVYRLTGSSMSELQQAQIAEALPYNIIKFAILPNDRERLRQRIAQRFISMIEQGFIDEVAALMQRPELSADTPALRAVGYRQLWSYLAGAMTREEAIEKGIIATRQFAKRQLTWLRGEPDLHNLALEDGDHLKKVLKVLSDVPIYS